MKETADEICCYFIIGMLTIVDLAGTENLQESGATGITAKEANNINLSLTTLTKVVRGLAGIGGVKHTPFRDSVLTRRMQPAFDADPKRFKLLMIAHISPDLKDTKHTKATLEFAHTAKGAVTGKGSQNPRSAAQKAAPTAAPRAQTGNAANAPTRNPRPAVNTGGVRPKVPSANQPRTAKK